MRTPLQFALDYENCMTEEERSYIFNLKEETMDDEERAELLEIVKNYGYEPSDPWR